MHSAGPVETRSSLKGQQPADRTNCFYISRTTRNFFIGQGVIARLYTGSTKWVPGSAVHCPMKWKLDLIWCGSDTQTTLGVQVFL